MYPNSRSYAIWKMKQDLETGTLSPNIEKSVEGYCNSFCRCEEGLPDKDHPENIHCLKCGKVMAQIVYALPENPAQDSPE